MSKLPLLLVGIPAAASRLGVVKRASSPRRGLPPGIAKGWIGIAPRARPANSHDDALTRCFPSRLLGTFYCTDGTPYLRTYSVLCPVGSPAWGNADELLRGRLSGQRPGCCFNSPCSINSSSIFHHLYPPAPLPSPAPGQARPGQVREVHVIAVALRPSTGGHIMSLQRFGRPGFTGQGPNEGMDLDSRLDADQHCGTVDAATSRRARSQPSLETFCPTPQP